MKKLYKAVFILFFLLSATQAIASPQAVCNWKARNPVTVFSDSCPAGPALNGYIAFNTNITCLKYKWTVNGITVGNNRLLNYRVSQNGTYAMCVTVTDTCLNCDTVFCNNVTIDCITPQCNWANLFTSITDSCTSTKRSIFGYSTLNNCWKYVWKINGAIVGTTRTLTYNVTQNGSYNVCLTVSDTCSHCDTTICSVKTFTCIAPHCTWTNLNTSFWDTCTGSRRSLNAYASLNSCWKYQWKVNGNVVSTSRLFTYPVLQNGTYNVCLTVIDTCTNCDTTICSTRVLNCTTVPQCNWANLFTSITDSCTNTKRSIFGYSTLNNCWKYVWKINGVIVGTTRTLTYNVTQNGSYNVCLTVSDTCSHCDTTICSVKTFTCIAPHCTWTNLNTSFWDTCTGSRRSLNAYASLNSCWKYQWKVNGNIVSTSRLFTYPVLQNGTYNVCLTVIDTCTNCDTSICSTRVLNCTTVPQCNWANLFTSITDSCTSTKRSIFGYSTLNNCWKYVWKINGAIVGTTRTLTYNVNQNGSYNVCLTISDTCSHCDTTICSVKSFTCIAPHCTWTNLNTAFWDTCTGSRRSLNAYASLNSCWKYQWKVNGNVVSTSRLFTYPVLQNGTYNVCLTVIDTCTNCDTSICSTRVLNCTTVPQCNWANLVTLIIDSCTNTKKAILGYATLNNCWKYQWKINGVLVATTRYFNYTVTQNGSYNVCLTIIDTCSHCDTTICSVKTFTCIAPQTCNWANLYTVFWDTCTGTKRSVSGYSVLNSCWKYQWKVNGLVVSNSRQFVYPLTQNGTYTVCLTVIDTCGHCDTTICSVRELNCNSNIPCNWKARNGNAFFWDSCSVHMKAVNGYISFPNTPTTCYKYQWLVNGQVVGTGRVLTYPVLQNGIYNVCVKVTDTCSHCDTTYCSVRQINCFTTATCNWNNRHPYTTFFDSCGTHTSVNGYIVFNSNMNCLKFQWKVNGQNAGTGRWLNYAVNQNGTYAICVTVTDTCDHCDTTFCSTRIITCINPGTPCNWQSKNPYVFFWDSCTTNKKSLNGYINFNSSMSCLKFIWTVNGHNAGTGRIFSYPVTANGTYLVCVSVIDTCHQCDTSFCSTRIINCINTTPPCNWSNPHPYTYFWDSCYANGNRYSVNGYISFLNTNATCYKYLWKVNGVNAGTGHVLNYPVTQNGTYNICVSVIDSCNHCDTTFCNTRTITCVHLLDPGNGAVNLQIYPNPSTGVVNIYCSEESCPYTLTSISGQEVKSGVLSFGNQQLDMTGFPTDIYVLRVKTKSMMLTRKFSLQN